jgi:ATP-binding cassette, subfamily C, bacterial
MPFALPDKRQIAPFFSLVWNGARRDFIKASMLQTLGSISEAFSIILLIPLLKLMGPGQQSIAISLSALPFGRFRGLELTITLPIVLAAFISLVILRSILLERKERYNSRVTFGFVSTFQRRLFRSVTLTKWHIISQYRTADMAQAMTANVDRLLITLNLLLQFVQSLVMTFIFAALSFVVSWQMTCVALAIGALLLLLTYPMRRRSFVHGQNIATHRRDEFRVIDSFLHGLRTAKTFNLEERHVASMTEVLFRVYRHNIDFMATRARTATIYQVTAAIALTGFIYFSLVVQSASLSTIVVMLFLFMRLAPRIMALHTILQDLLSNLGAIGSMLALLRECEENRDDIAVPDCTKMSALDNEIRLDNLVFHYPGSETPTLNDISTRIVAKQITAIIGPSGSGKSTLVDVIMGLLPPSSGEIIVDGEPLDETRRRRWQSSIAYVPQETFLFNESIAQNLRVADANASDGALWQVLKLANADEIVRSKPEGLNHVVGDRGTELSGGERQRIAIARALLRKPKLLILDEATSALDWKSEARIVDSIRSLRDEMTIIIVAHRPSMVALADNIISLHNGRLAASGAASVLSLPNSGYLREMMDADSY